MNNGCLSSGHARWCMAYRCILVAEGKIDVRSDWQGVTKVWEGTASTFLRVSRLLDLQFVLEHLLAAYLKKKQQSVKRAQPVLWILLTTGPNYSSGLCGRHKLWFKKKLSVREHERKRKERKKEERKNEIFGMEDYRLLWL